MRVAWDVAKRNFTDDDGSLPGIEFTRLSPESVRRLVDFFRRHGTITTANATLHDNSREADVPLHELNDPVGLVLSGTADSFHCCFGGITHGGVAIPVLGLFVFRDCVEIDYRMGAEWNRDNVDAFFRLLAHLKLFAPEANIDSAENEGLPYPEDFKVALDQYTEMQRA
jgi:hypothetical protein